MECPPSKRLKGMNYGAPCTSDPFGDDGDFTQDDLEEIDIMASQAYTGDVGVAASKDTLGTAMHLPGVQSKEGRKTFTLDGRSNPGNSNTGSTYQPPTVEASRKKQQFKSDRGDLSYGRLEAQQTELRKKLMEVEEKLLMKDGEIRVLRDSIRHAQQEQEHERQAQLVLEKERAQVQSDREKELLKRVQSLQSELHFKDAEMNEMKSKLQTSERGNKRIASSTARQSPRRCWPAGLAQDGCAAGGASSGAPPAVSPFLTKESFAAQLSRRPSPAKTDRVSLSSAEDGRRLANETNNNINKDAQDVAFSGPKTHGCEESTLLNLLLQHPLDPSCMGLSHLLCISPDALPGLLLQHSYLSTRSSVGSSCSSSGTKAAQRPQSGFSRAQTLALSGLSMLTLGPRLPGHSAPIATAASVSVSGAGGQLEVSRKCPGAVHLLPLLEYHIGLFCQFLEAVDGSGKSPLRGSSLPGPASGEGSVGSSMDTLGSLEEFALAALSALCHLLSQSADAVRTLISHQPPPLPEAKRPNPTVTRRGKTGRPQAPVSQHPLLGKLLQLADPAFTGPACQREKVLAGSLNVLNVLAERAGDELLGSLKFVVKSQFLARCLSADSSYRTVSLSVSLLALAANNEEVASQLCSQLEACPLLKMLQYVTDRPDKTATQSQWSQLELEVVRFLTLLFTQKTSTWMAFIKSSCQCNSEVVRTLVVLLHRQWLEVRRWECQDQGEEGEQQEQREQAWAGPGVHLLREALLLLHWLLLNHARFSEHSLGVLHLYDQVVPAIRDTFRKIPCLTESEELALEEICRPESEDAEDMDIDNGS